MSQESRRDVLTHALAARFAHTFDRPVPAAVATQGIHWSLCTPEVATEALGEDGHPAGGGGFLPPSPLPRRMWAASEVLFERPLRIGAEVERRSRVVAAKEKTGSSGALLFVTVAHDVLSEDVIAIRETQTIVYREVAKPNAAAASAPVRTPAPAGRVDLDWPWRRRITPGPPLLFRYSALTFNTHRIHYDLPYARGTEGYPGLVVHGPLMATLLLDLADRELGANRLARFAFRAQSPAFANEALTLLGRPDGEAVSLAILGTDGRTVMTAEAGIAA